MHSIEQLMLIINLWFLNYGLETRILTFYQNKLLPKMPIFSRSTQYYIVENFMLIVLI